jgi:hypothetical protein
VTVRAHVGDENHLTPFASFDAEACLAENDPEGLAFEYPARV